MKTNQRWQFAAAWALIAVLLSSCATTSRPPILPPGTTIARATLAVVVRDAATGQDLEGAAVTLHTGETGTTNAAGYIEWRGLELGGRGITVTAAGYVDQFFSLAAFTGNTQVPIALVKIAPPAPVVISSFRPFVGPVRVQDKLFRDDSGYRRVFFASWFTALRVLRENPAEFTRQLDALASAGYQGARVFLAVGGWMDFWDGHEVVPITFQKWHYTGNFLRTDRLGDTVGAWPDYDDRYRELLRAFKARKLRLHVTTGDMQMIVGNDQAKELELHRRWSRIAAEEGGTDVIALVEATNEFVFNRFGGSSPESIAQMGRIIAIWRQAIPGVLTAQGAIPQDEEPASLTLASTHGDVAITHTTRSPFGVSLKRTLGVIYFEGSWRAFPKPFWQGEPAGPELDSFDRLDDPASLVALYAMHALTGQASNQFSGNAVRGRAPIDQAWGFRELPGVLSQLPEDVATWKRETAGHGAILYWTHDKNFATSTFAEWDSTPPRPVAEWTLYTGTGTRTGTGAPPKATGLLIGRFQ